MRAYGCYSLIPYRSISRSFAFSYYYRPRIRSYIRSTILTSIKHTLSLTDKLIYND